MAGAGHCRCRKSNCRGVIRYFTSTSTVHHFWCRALWPPLVRGTRALRTVLYVLQYAFYSKPYLRGYHRHVPTSAVRLSCALLQGICEALPWALATNDDQSHDSILHFRPSLLALYVTRQLIVTLDQPAIKAPHSGEPVLMSVGILEYCRIECLGRWSCENAMPWPWPWLGV